MKIMVDTNVVISAALFPGGRAAQAFFKAMLPPMNLWFAIISWTNCIENSGRSFLIG